MKKYLFFTVLTIFTAVLFVACSKDDDDSNRYPQLNKESFSLSSLTPDTLYSVNKKDYTLERMVVLSRTDNSTLGELKFSSNQADIVAGGNKIGTVSYRNGKVSAIDIPDLCNISFLGDILNKKCAYKIQAYANASSSPYYITIFAMDGAPVGITIK